MRRRVAIVSTHVIQHFPPLFRRLARQDELAVRVFYASTAGVTLYDDAGFGRAVAWDSDLLSGYGHEFLPGAEGRPPSGFLRIRGGGLESRLEAFDPDDVFVFGYTPAVMLRALAFARRRGRRALMMTDSERRQPRPLPTRVMKALVLPPLLRQVSGFFTVGDRNEEYLRHYGVPPEKMFRGGYPTDEERFLAARGDRERRRREARRRWGVGPSAFVALFVGKLITRKRPLDLAHATLEVRADTRPVVTVFAGDGALKSAIETVAAGCSERFRLLGFVNQSALADTYAGADVLVHPAERDPHPLAVTEAAMVGLPVVVSDRVGAVGPTDTARPDVNAVVYEMGSVEQLAAALRRLATDAVLFERMAAATAQVAAETGLDACVEGFRRMALAGAGYSGRGR
jgi:glycosyltransferase involved in cell wall biosynthesis